MINVFVSGGSSIVGYGILRSFQGMDVNLISSSIYPFSAANRLANEFVLAPKTNSSQYKGWLIDLLRNHKIDLAIPGFDDDMYFWNQHRDIFKQYEVEVILNTSDLIELCKDKWSFYQFLQDTNCKQFLIPTMLATHKSQAIEEFGESLIFKPRKGFGSKGMFKTRDRNDCEDLHLEEPMNYIVQKIIGSDHEEYTLGVFGDGAGNYHDLISMKRTLSSEGYTQTAEVVSDQPFLEAVATFCKELKPIGPTNFQFRLTAEGPKLLEINPRFSSSSSMRAQFGFNEAYMVSEYLYRKKPFVKGKIKKGKAVRILEDIIEFE